MDNLENTIHKYSFIDWCKGYIPNEAYERVNTIIKNNKKTQNILLDITYNIKKAIHEQIWKTRCNK